MITLVRNPFLTVEIRRNIAVIWLDQEGEAVNKISPELILSFARVLDEIESLSDIRGAVLISRKKDFVAGADLARFLEMEPGEAAESGTIGHGILNRIANSKKTYIAAIHGACMGAGLEIALACHIRIAVNDPTTILSLPEVKVGLLPGGGGTQRLPRLIGIQQALGMMLTGRNVYVHQAFEMGLIDRMCGKDELLEKSMMLVEKGKIRRRRKRSLSQQLIEMIPATRNLVFQKAREKTLEQTKGNYPAPEKIIDCVEVGYRRGMKKGAQMEIHQFDELVRTPVARQLIQLFFSMTELKKNHLEEQAKKVKKIGIIGAGKMGSGIAEVSALKGFSLGIQDVEDAPVLTIRKSIREALDKRVRRKAISGYEADEIFSRVKTGFGTDLFEDADLVIETAQENLELKQQLLAETEKVMPEGAIYATGTSGISIKDIARASQRPEQVIGLNYFYPVQDMMLLEIVTTPQTPDWVIATATEMGIAQGKICIVVKDGPGFFTNRILAAMFRETMTLLKEGADIVKIDFVLEKFGFSYGPVALMDRIGFEALHNGNKGRVEELFESRGYEQTNFLPRMIEKGYLGKKNGKGFYQYDESTGRKVKGDVNKDIYEFFGGRKRRAFSSIRIQHRIALSMVNEAAHCLGEGIIRSPRDGDVGAIFGPGFPPFLGGPFRFADSMGISKMIHMLRELEEDYGRRFAPAPIFHELAEQGMKFY